MNKPQFSSSPQAVFNSYRPNLFSSVRVFLTLVLGGCSDTAVRRSWYALKKWDANVLLAIWNSHSCRKAQAVVPSFSFLWCSDGKQSDAVSAAMIKGLWADSSWLNFPFKQTNKTHSKLLDYIWYLFQHSCGRGLRPGCRLVPLLLHSQKNQSSDS